jgi:hypothetical protein
MINADADGSAAMYTTARRGDDVWRRWQSTVAADNSIDSRRGGSRRGWQSTVVAVGGGGVNGGSERGGRIIIWSAFWGSGEQCSTCFYVVLCTIWYQFTWSFGSH